MIKLVKQAIEQESGRKLAGLFSLHYGVSYVGYLPVLNIELDLKGNTVAAWQIDLTGIIKQILDYANASDVGGQHLAVELRAAGIPLNGAKGQKQTPKGKKQQKSVKPMQVTKTYAKSTVAVFLLSQDDTLSVGDEIEVVSNNGISELHRVYSIQVKGKNKQTVTGQEVGIKVSDKSFTFKKGDRIKVK